MKALWVGIGIVCVVVAGVAIFTYHDCEAARSYMLGIIDEAMLESTWDTQDYIEPNRSHLYFRNSGSLQTLRNAITTAKMSKTTGTFPVSHSPIVYIGKQEIGYVDEWESGNPTSLFWEYPDGAWWFAELDDTYKYVLIDYIHNIGKEGSRRFKMVITDECLPTFFIFKIFCI